MGGLADELSLQGKLLIFPWNGEAALIRLKNARERDVQQYGTLLLDFTDVPLANASFAGESRVELGLAVVAGKHGDRLFTCSPSRHIRRYCRSSIGGYGRLRSILQCHRRGLLVVQTTHPRAGSLWGRQFGVCQAAGSIQCTNRHGNGPVRSKNAARLAALIGPFSCRRCTVAFRVCAQDVADGAHGVDQARFAVGF